MISFTNIVEQYLKIFKNKKISIIAISSIAAIKVINAPITYSVSKAALQHYCKIKAKELAKHNINLNIISPGNIYMPNNNWGKKQKQLGVNYANIAAIKIVINALQKKISIF